MMHTFKSGDVTFFYNSDLSGEVAIKTGNDVVPVWVNGDAILEFVAEYVRAQKIAAIEQATTGQLLGIESPTEDRHATTTTTATGDGEEDYTAGVNEFPPGSPGTRPVG